jgi:hypothetical protein
MLALFAAAALMQSTADRPPADADTRCMAAYLFIVGQMEDDKTTTEEERSGATSIVMYFFGKVRARTPSSDLKEDVRRLVEAPDYIETRLKPDIERCGKEFMDRASELEAFGGE